MPREYPGFDTEEKKQENRPQTSDTVVDTGPAPTLISDADDNARIIDAAEAKKIRESIATITREEYLREKKERDIQKLQELWPGTTFGDTPDNVMKQGRGGNCYAICALEGIKRNKRAFDALFDNIGRLSDGGWRVSLYDADYKSPDFIHITLEELEKDSAHGMSQGSLGDKILERACQSFVSRKRRTEAGDNMPVGKTMEGVPEKGNKKMWEGGLPHKVLSELLGSKYQKFFAHGQREMVDALHEIDADRRLPPDQQKIVATAFTKKELEEIPEKKSGWKFWQKSGEKKNPQEKIFPKHAYTLVGVDRENGNVSLVNPHDTSITFQISFKEFFEKFIGISYVKEMEERKDVKNATMRVR